MGNVLDGLKGEFATSSARKWGINELETSLASFEKMVTPGTMSMTYDMFAHAFSKLSMRDSIRHFKPFSERQSAHRLATGSRKASSLTVFTGFCLLSAASDEEKMRFIFNLFDFGNTNSLCIDELTVALTCILRALATIKESIPTLLKAKPEFIDELVKEPFHSAGAYLYWSEFLPYARNFVEEYLEEVNGTCKSPVPTRPEFGGFGFQDDHKNQKPCKKRSGSAEKFIVVDDEVFREDMETKDEQTKAAQHAQFFSNNNVDFDEPEKFLQREGPSIPEIIEPEFIAPRSNNNHLGPHDHEGQERNQEEEDDEDDENDEDDDEEEDGGGGEFLDASQAVEQILACLPEIDNGDLSSLPWVLDALRLLGEHDGCETLGLIVSQVLPLVCNVAACEDPALAYEAMNVLGIIVTHCPDRVADCADTVNERALLEMLMVRSADEDPMIASSSTTCLLTLVEQQPYGFGRTIAAILEAGTLHELPAVVVKCADACEHLISNMPDKLYVGADLDGRVGLLLSALCLWAHGEIMEAKHSAKMITLKLGVRYGGDIEWEIAIENTDSYLLHAWNRGMDPSPEEEMAMEQEFQYQKKMEELNSKMEEPELDQDQCEAGHRCWIVPAGYEAFPCPVDATMYPQVFAILGYRGRGGPLLGVMPQSAFDMVGSFRKREIITESKKVEYSKVLRNGKVQVFEEIEETVKEITHLEASNGLFAHRETVRVTQKEAKGGNVTRKEKNKQDFVHFKNETGEVSTYIDIESPKSPLLESPTSQFGYAFSAVNIKDVTNVDLSQIVENEHRRAEQPQEKQQEEDACYIVEEPETPRNQ